MIECQMTVSIRLEAIFFSSRDLAFNGIDDDRIRVVLTRTVALVSLSSLLS